jgi:hypothetical protein
LLLPSFLPSFLPFLKDFFAPQRGAGFRFFRSAGKPALPFEAGPVCVWALVFPSFCHRGVIMTRHSFVGFVVSFMLAAGAAQGAEIGQLISVVPGVFAAREGKTIPLALRSPVEPSDVISTDATGRARILFNDDSTVAIGGNTRLEMRDFADSGEKPVFDAHLMQGVARVVTGRVVEMNPSGFRVTTPEAHVGIRGTIISLRTANGVTTVYVENTTREVYVNDVRIPGGEKITLPGDPLRHEPIQPEDRRGLGRDLAFLGGRGVAAAAPEPGMTERLPAETPLAYVSADGGAAPPDTPLKNLTLGTDLAGSSLGPLTGFVSGSLASLDTLHSGDFIGNFSFEINLSSGAITNATLSGSASIAFDTQTSTTGALIVNFVGGTGSVDVVYGTYDIHNFTESGVNLFNGSPLDPTTAAQSYMKGLADPRTIPNGGTVPANYGIDYGSGPYYEYDFGGGSGTMSR